MKTNNVILRPMGQFEVAQRTKDGFFNATELLKQWNGFSGMQKQMNHYTDIEPTKEFIKALLLEENLKERSDVLIQHRGKKGGTWMHPVLFIDFAMWLNPSFKVKVIKFVYDQMIKYRNDAGDAYRKLAVSVQKIVAPSFMPAAMINIAKAINHVVFGDHETLMRNKVGEEDKQQELFSLELKLSELINDGFITNYDNLINYLRKKWRDKYTPLPLR